MSVWQPGAELHQFDALIQPLRLTRVASTDMTVVADDSEYDEDSTTTFQAAVAILKADLALNDATVEQALSISWDELAAYEVALCPDLRVRSDLRLLSTVPPVPIHAWVSAADQTLYVTDANLAGLAEHGGLALAALFAPVNPRLISLPWLAAWTKAAAGIREQAVTIAARKEAEEAAQRSADSERRLKELQRGSAKRNKKPPPRGGGTAGGSGVKPTRTATPPNPPRTLVDPTRLWLTDAEGTLVAGSKPPARPDKPTRPITDPVPLTGPDTPPPPPRSRRGPMAYTSGEREDVGMALVRHILASDDSNIVDIRNQRNVGADAVDSLKKFYELKVHSGEIPDRVQLTNAEVQRALTTPDFFLVLVGNVEDGNGATEARIINDPLTHLNVTPSGSVTFTGVRTAQALRYAFSDTPEPGEGLEAGQSESRGTSGDPPG